MWASPARAMSVKIAPGWIEFTRMPFGPNSSAAALVIPRIANLLATYDMMPAPGTTPFIDEMLMIEPPGRNTAPADFMPSQQPTWLTLMTDMYSSNDTSSIIPMRMMPALLMSTSRPPKLLVAVRTARVQSSWRVTSRCT